MTVVVVGLGYLGWKELLGIWMRRRPRGGWGSTAKLGQAADVEAQRPSPFLIRQQPPRSSEKPLEWYANTSAGHVR